MVEEVTADDVARMLDEGFPFYYPMSAPFLLDGDPSGAVGARAELTRELNNFPHIFYGLRLRNVYPMPSIDNADDWNLLKQLDADQLIRIDLAQQNIVAQPTLQDTVTGGLAGRGGGVTHWHPFPHPYLLAGGNNIDVEVTRITGYPDLAQDLPVHPVCYATLVTAVFRRGLRTVPPSRVHADR
jgi:hypothetical protein